MKIIYMGTPEIAVPALLKIIEAGHKVLCAVTQPDRAKGRHKELIACPVKQAASEHGIPVLQPEKARDEAFIEQLKTYEPDVIVVMAYGQILTKALLDIPRFGCINIHASLLPKYRGAAPLNAVILNGEIETGVTTMFMDEGLDTGDMLLKAAVAIDPKETTETLEPKIASIGGELIIDTLNRLEQGTLERIPQNDADSTYVRMMKKEEGLIDWTQDAAAIERRIRAFYPWPGTYTNHEGHRIKIYDADVVSGDYFDFAPGTIIDLGKDFILVACGNDALKLNDLQAEGKKRMLAADFLRGYKLSKGDILA